MALLTTKYQTCIYILWRTCKIT